MVVNNEPVYTPSGIGHTFLLTMAATKSPSHENVSGYRAADTFRMTICRWDQCRDSTFFSLGENGVSKQRTRHPPLFPSSRDLVICRLSFLLVHSDFPAALSCLSSCQYFLLGIPDSITAPCRGFGILALLSATRVPRPFEW